MHSSITVFGDLNHLNYCFIKNKIGIRRECQGLGKSEFYKKKKKVYPGIKRDDLHYTLCCPIHYDTQGTCCHICLEFEECVTTLACV
jgi:hypothetical protein